VADELATVPRPGGPVYRVARIPDPFAPPDWMYALTDGTFGGRFDDPAGRLGIPPRRRFQTLYFAGSPAGAFAEAISRFRPDLDVQSALHGSRAAAGTVPAEWRAVRRVGMTVIEPSAVFVDIGDARTLAVLRRVLAPTALRLDVPDVDLSAVTGPVRQLTQEAARYLYELRTSAGHPRFAGIRYTSRLDRSWECWAIFTDRLAHRVIRVDAIEANDAGLLEAARRLGLRVL
jgi:RES domain